MTDEITDQPINRESQSQAPAVPPLQENPASQNAQQMVSDADKRITDLEDRIRRGEKWMIWLTGAIAFFALCQFGVAVFQYVYGGEQTDRIIAADERLATAMENSVKEAGKSLDATIDNFHLDQRAWLGPNEMLPPPFMDGNRRVYMKGGEQAQYAVIITNTGKTPAKKVIQSTS
jgi:hypothetical protein